MAIATCPFKEFSGILVPTEHAVFGRQPDGSPAPTPLVASIDMSRIAAIHR
jgi:hypothetical protein